MVLAQSGEFALVLFSLANRSELLPDELFQQLLLVVLLSMIATPLLAQFSMRLIRALETEAEACDEHPLEAPIVLAGFGRVGHRIGEILSQAGKSYVALDSNAAVVRHERDKGHPVFYGDVRQPEVFRSACARNAEAIIVTLNDPIATETLLLSLRKTYPDTPIYVRCTDMADCRKLRRLGATGVVSENLEASMELARKALSHIGFNDKDLKHILVNFRHGYNAQIEEEH